MQVPFRGMQSGSAGGDGDLSRLAAIPKEGCPIDRRTFVTCSS
jgi:hypothetical protein